MRKHIRSSPNLGVARARAFVRAELRQAQRIDRTRTRESFPTIQEQLQERLQGIKPLPQKLKIIKAMISKLGTKIRDLRAAQKIARAAFESGTDSLSNLRALVKLEAQARDDQYSLEQLLPNFGNRPR
jgi:predicted nuclease with TOPRIM domain